MAETHRHEGFEIPPGFADPLGRPVDHDLLGRLVGACFDSCRPCQSTLLTRLADDAITSARLVELACVAVHRSLGGLPSNLTRDERPGLAGPEFRRLARAGADGNKGGRPYRWRTRGRAGGCPAERAAGQGVALRS